MQTINKRKPMEEYKEEKITYSDGSYAIKYTKQYHNCYCCGRKTHKSRVKVLQDDFFTKTIVAKKVCRICYKQAKLLLEEAKPQLLATKWYRDR